MNGIPSPHTGALLTLEQAAEALGAHPSAVRALIGRGALRVVRLWRSVRVPLADVALLAAAVR